MIRRINDRLIPPSSAGVPAAHVLLAKQDEADDAQHAVRHIAVDNTNDRELRLALRALAGFSGLFVPHFERGFATGAREPDHGVPPRSAPIGTYSLGNFGWLVKESV